MNITREKLIDLARREAEQRAELGDVISGYLIGSVARGEPFVGGQADIDLVLIHDGKPAQEREIMRLSAEVHLDILHHAHAVYRSPKELRVDPWLGPSLCEPIFLHDPSHFFERAQAGARGQYHRPDHALARARAFLERARHAHALLPLSTRWVHTYCRALLDAANSVAALDGFPASGRRVALLLAQKAYAQQVPEAYEGFVRCLSAEALLSWDIPSLLQAWARTLDAAAERSTDPELHPSRRDYYLRAFQSFADDGLTHAIVWPMLVTWERAIFALSEQDGTQAWGQTLEQLGLNRGQRPRRERDLQGFINQMEQEVELWAEKNGA